MELYPVLSVVVTVVTVVTVGTVITVERELVSRLSGSLPPLNLVLAS